MKSYMKKMLLVCLAASLAVSVFGCSKKEEEDMQVETISLEQTKQDLTFSYKQGPGVDATEAEGDAEKQETEGEAADAEFEEVTDFVEVTDAEGQAVTNAEGVVETQAVVVETRPASGTSGGGNASGNNGNTGNNGNSGSTGNSGNAQPYKPAYDICKAYWLDMSQADDYTFDGEFLIVTFQVNENTPDGSYPVSIAATDIASWELVSYDPVRIDGEVAVNQTPAAQADANDSDFTLKVNSATAKQGELATVVIDLSNNPGFCGFVVDIQYDSNALTIMDASGGADFNKTVQSIG